MLIKCVRCGLLVLESQARGWCPRCGGPLAAVLQPMGTPPHLDRPTDRSNLPSVAPPRLPLGIGNPNARTPVPAPRRSKISHPSPVLSVAVRILAFLDNHGGVGKRQLNQRMQNRLFPHWELAL